MDNDNSDTQETPVPKLTPEQQEQAHKFMDMHHRMLADYCTKYFAGTVQLVTVALYSDQQLVMWTPSGWSAEMTSTFLETVSKTIITDEVLVKQKQ